jgi:hypothetical protein
MSTARLSIRPLVSPAGLIAAGLFIYISSALIQKHLGWPGLAAYTAGTAAAIWLAMWIFPRVEGFMERHFPAFLGLFAAGLAVIFAVAYPIENGKKLGKGSDRDDGLNIATERLFAGESPYYPPNNPRAGPLSLLPGAILLAAPFKLLGNCSYQNLFWICAFVWALAKHWNNRALALACVATAFALCPALQYEFISGGDMLANGIYITLFLSWTARTWSTPETRPGIRGLAAILLGIGLASRPNFLFVLPLLGGYLWQTAGWGRAISASGISLAVAAAVTLPFYFHDPAGFSPWIAGNKLALLNASYPQADSWLKIVLLLATLAMALHLMFTKKPPAPTLLFRHVTVAIALPMILVVILFSLAKGYADFSFMHPRYGLMYLFAGFFAWKNLEAVSQAPPIPTKP